MDGSLLQQIIDKLALDALMYRQALAVDECDWDSYRACLADEIDFDFGEHLDGFIEKSVGTIVDPEDWTSTVRSCAGFDATMHLISNMTHQIAGDQANSICYMVNNHVVGAHRYTAAQLHYFNSVRTKVERKLYKRRLRDAIGEDNP